MNTSFWVFGYGSLMWRPGFAFAERRRARLTGWRRSFCLSSIHYRGTPEEPGLVLGLDQEPEGSCEGVAYLIGDADAAATYAYLRERELVSYAYLERFGTTILDDGRQVDALIYVIDRDHDQYAGRLSPGAQAEIISRAAGSMGPNRDYLHNTVAHLREMGVRDAEMEEIAALVPATPAP